MESGLVPIRDVLPSPDNAEIYRPFDPSKADDAALVDGIREHGILEPLVITTDNVILSGHRRHAAAVLLGLDTVPVRVDSDVTYRECAPDEWLRLLRNYNDQRVKSLDEVLREQIVMTTPDDAYSTLVQYRANRSRVTAPVQDITGTMTRAGISPAKAPFLEAIKNVLDNMAEYLPISVRSLHYQLLNNPPLMHASKPDSVYRNNKASYRSLDELATRARLTGAIPWTAIKDDTRPVELWSVHGTPAGFLRKELDNMFRGYWRDLMQSQPNHIEIIVEKKTMTGIVQRVAADYTIPVTSGGGFCSLPPRYEMAERFRRSGKTRLVLILLSDFDPDGIEIAQSFARSLRDDFNIPDVDMIRAAVTAPQIEELHLVANMTAKTSSSNYKKFAELYGDDVFELEAIAPADLTRLLRETIEGALDMPAFEAEQAAERDDAATVDTWRQRATAALQDIA